MVWPSLIITVPFIEPFGTYVAALPPSIILETRTRIAPTMAINHPEPNHLYLSFQHTHARHHGMCNTITSKNGFEGSDRVTNTKEIEVHHHPAS